MIETYDAIVVGLGAAGSPTAYRLAQCGQRVLGLEMYEPGHAFGSSHGYHRMIRKASIQGDGYEPLADRAFELWDELEEETGREFLTIVGEVRLLAGSDGSDPRYRSDAEEMQRRGFWEILDETELGKRFPGFRLHEGMIATYEADAGFLWSERGIITHIELARQHGATVRTSEEVTGWEPDGEGVRVTTSKGTYRAGKLIITTGAYAGELLGDLELPMQVNRSINGYFEPSRPDWWRAEHGGPDFILDVPEGGFYGMPAIGDIGLKIGLSTQDKTGPRTIRRTIEPEEVQYLARHARQVHARRGGRGSGRRSPAWTPIRSMITSLSITTRSIRRSSLAVAFPAEATNSRRSSVRSWPTSSSMAAPVTTSASCRPGGSDRRCQ